MNKKLQEYSDSITNDIRNQFQSWLLYQKVINEINSNPQFSGMKELINSSAKASIKSKAILKHIEQNHLQEWYNLTKPI